MVEPLKIYLGDLTYNTISLSTEVFPLNIGYIASYCKKQFGNKVDITLFKYIEELEDAIENSPPDILGMSNYAWCHRLGLEMFRIALQKNPQLITVWGGPNFPQDIPSQEKFMKSFPEVDVYVPIDGETGFSNVVSFVLESNSKKEVKKKLNEKPIDGCITRDTNGNLQYSNPVIRINELDEVPSPYLTGILDKFFDGKLSPMIQTNRGCPFTCTFCTDGSEFVKKVNNFSLDRVKNELEYIAKHVPEKIHNMTISDLNFGMWPRDLEICDIIGKVQKEYGYPRLIQSTTGKNKKERIIESVKKLDGALRVMMSVQSMDKQVLGNIRRENISVDTMIDLAPAIKESNLSTTAEVILALPGETYESHIKTLRDLVSVNINYIRPYTLMLLNGSQLNTPVEREKWGFKTKFRILAKDFAKLSNGKKVIEVEEVVVGTNTLSFDEYVELRTLAFIMFVTNIGLVYDPIVKFLREKKVDVFELFFRTLKYKNSAPQKISNVIQEYQQETIKELWDSPEEIEAHFQDDKEYEKLLEGRAGINVLQHFQAVIMFNHMKDWTEYTLKIASELLKENTNFDENLQEQFKEIANYCRGLSFNPLGEDREKVNPEFSFGYDIKKWLIDDSQLELTDFKFDLKKKIVFQFSDEQFKLVQDGLDQCGETMVGKSRIFRWIPPNSIWRTPLIEN